MILALGRIAGQLRRMAKKWVYSGMSHALPSARAMGDSTEVIGVQDSSMISKSWGSLGGGER